MGAYMNEVQKWPRWKCQNGSARQLRPLGDLEADIIIFLWQNLIFTGNFHNKKNLESGKWAKVLVAKSDDLSLGPKTHMTVENNQLLWVVL